ncbi:MAPEG family protein [Acidiphilium multivorum]|uniref:MAPEG family protein n=1 Tax=Acidiphilium multivorum TaxID=62140 RepID=UPI0039C8CF9D
MTFPTVAAGYGALLALIYLVLSLWVGFGRFGFRVIHGDGGNDRLARRIRAHANFAEYVPLILLLAALLEASGAGRLEMSLLDAASGTSAVPESGVTTTAGSNPATLGPVSWFGWSAVSSSRPDRARGVVHSRGQEWPQAIA